MKVTFTVFIASALCIHSGNAAESQLVRSAAEAVVQSLLTSQATPRRGNYRVGVVNRTHGFSLLVSQRDAAAIVEVAHGANGGRFELLTDAIRQLSDPEIMNPRFRIVRKTIEATNCPELTGAIHAFYSDLDAVLSVPVRLSSPPPGPRLDPSTGAVMPVYTDQITYSVQIATEDAIVEIRPLGGYRPPLQQSVAQLEAVAMRCSYAIEGRVQDVSG
jgi:hypothetical protein